MQGPCFTPRCPFPFPIILFLFSSFPYISASPTPPPKAICPILCFPYTQCFFFFHFTLSVPHPVNPSIFLQHWCQVLVPQSPSLTTVFHFILLSPQSPHPSCPTIFLQQWCREPGLHSDNINHMLLSTIPCPTRPFSSTSFLLHHMTAYNIFLFFSTQLFPSSVGLLPFFHQWLGLIIKPIKI